MKCYAQISSSTPELSQQHLSWALTALQLCSPATQKITSIFLFYVNNRGGQSGAFTVWTKLNQNLSHNHNRAAARIHSHTPAPAPAPAFMHIQPQRLHQILQSFSTTVLWAQRALFRVKRNKKRKGAKANRKCGLRSNRIQCSWILNRKSSTQRQRQQQRFTP